MSERVATRSINSEAAPATGQAPSVDSALSIIESNQEEILDDGWIYKDGFLWRELQIIDSQYCDVDLQASAGYLFPMIQSINLQLGVEIGYFKVPNYTTPQSTSSTTQQVCGDFGYQDAVVTTTNS